MNVAPTAQNSVFTVLAAGSWGLVEVPRYLFYALNLIDLVPYPLFWLRYSLFAVLYPTGITGELGCMYQAALYLLGSGSFADMSTNNKILFGAFILVFITYIPGNYIDVLKFSAQLKFFRISQDVWPHGEDSCQAALWLQGWC